MLKKIFIKIIRLYQLLFGSLIGPCCRFYPSCSYYSMEAIGKHGILKGLFLTMKRLIKCHPWHKGGVDPVP